MKSYYTDVQCVVFNINTLNVTLFDKGNPIKRHVNNFDKFIEFCNQHLVPGVSILLLGSNQSEKIIADLESKFIVYSYDIENDSFPKQESPHQHLMNEVLDVVKEVKELLIKEHPTRTANALISTPSPLRETSNGINELKIMMGSSFEKIIKMNSESLYLINQIYNQLQTGIGSNSSEIVEDLRKELAEYKNDFYQKSMQQFGVNITINILERLYVEKDQLMHQENVNEELTRITQIISFCETKMKKLNLRISHSSDGDEFDGRKMITYDDKVSTDNTDLKGRVAYSIFPAIYWTLPRVNAPGEDELLIKEETVALYE